MPRSGPALNNQPFRTWTVTVDGQNRVRISISEIGDVLPWLTSQSGTIECFARPGAVGGIQFQPLEFVENLRREFADAVRGRETLESESSERWVDAARLLAIMWPATISVENSRISLTLPEQARRGLQLPGAGEVAIVFAVGRILEVWPAAQWYEHTRRLLTQERELLSRALDEVGPR